jgi:hypothetical protein
LNKSKISIFGGISKFRLWADLGRFGQILADFGQFWAEFATLTVAESLP